MEDDVAVVIEADRIAGAVEHRVALSRQADEGVGDELFGRQLRPAVIALGDARPADQQLALLARLDEAQLLADDIGGVVRDRLADGDGLAGHDLRGGRNDGRLGRPIGVEDAPARLRPFLHDRRRQRLAAEQDQLQRGHVGRQDAEQRRHGVDHGDAGLLEDGGQLLRIAHHLRRGDEQRRADEIGRPDLLHRKVEGDRCALEDDVVRPDAVERVTRAQEMADVAMADDDRLRRARRAGGVDQIGRMVLGQPGGPCRRLGPVGMCGQPLGRPDGPLDRLRPTGPAGAGDDALGRRIVQAGRDALDRGLRIEGHPGRACARDRDLRDEQVDAARHPQPDHVAGPDASKLQPARLPTGFRPDFGIAQAPLAIDEGGMIRANGDCRREDFGQHLVTDQVRALLARHHGKGISAGRVRRRRQLRHIVHRAPLR